MKWSLYTLATMLANGVCSIVQKFHQMKYPALYRNEFMLYSLLCVFIILFVTLMVKPSEKQNFKFSFLGFMSGVLNGVANYVVLYLSVTENASVLFPIVSVANIAAVWICGILFFKERLTFLQTMGLVTGVISIVLLKL